MCVGLGWISISSSTWKFYLLAVFCTCILPFPVEFPDLSSGRRSKFSRAIEQHFVRCWQNFHPLQLGGWEEVKILPPTQNIQYSQNYQFRRMGVKFVYKRVKITLYQCAWKFYLFCRMYSYVEKYCESTCGGVHTVLQRQASRHHNVCHAPRTQHSPWRFAQHRRSSNHGFRCQQHYLRPHSAYPSNRLVSDRLRSRLQGNASIV